MLAQLLVQARIGYLRKPERALAEGLGLLSTTRLQPRYYLGWLKKCVVTETFPTRRH